MMKIKTEEGFEASTGPVEARGVDTAECLHNSIDRLYLTNSNINFINNYFKY
jgi:hypothetical protein